MKTLSFKTLAVATGLASLSAFYGGSALAGDPDYNYALQSKPFVGTNTREQVRAEYSQAAKDGNLPRVSDYALPITAKAPPSTLTREAMHADTIEWLRATRGDVQMGSI